MDILILGGGVFLGAATLQAAVARGHTVTVFNRGRARNTWPAGVAALTGDRATDLGALQGRRWDAVIDTCGYVPVDVQASAEALKVLRQLPVCLQRLGLRDHDAGAGARNRRARVFRPARPGRPKPRTLRRAESCLRGRGAARVRQARAEILTGSSVRL